MIGTSLTRGLTAASGELMTSVVHTACLSSMARSCWISCVHSPFAHEPHLCEIHGRQLLIVPALSTLHFINPCAIG